ncbi:MAG: 5'-3' exonuclease H3TH domain-containing protein, partial [Gammaproteobacteria bacterium]|nr:5'-3' exonuclease H3TH domain-containing protein [Gammaproteobacteria bacterium]
MNLPKSLVLVDASSYLFRAYHAMPPLTNSQGEPVGAIYGMVNMLKRLLADHDTAYVGLVFDAEGKTFRDDMYAEYKANRSAMPDELARQVEPIHEVVSALGFPVVEVAGVEADDVIGTLARRATALGVETIVSTGDKDMAQLVTDHVTLVNTMDDSRLDPAGVEAKFGVRPGLMTDFLSLVGDAIDNVPGVPTVGPKTAAKWLRQFGSLDAVMENAAEIKGKVGEKLRSSLEHLPLSRDLVTIKCDVDVGLEPLDL